MSQLFLPQYRVFKLYRFALSSQEAGTKRCSVKKVFSEIRCVRPTTLLKKRLLQVFFCEFFENSKNAFSYRAPLVVCFCLYKKVSLKLYIKGACFDIGESRVFSVEGVFIVYFLYLFKLFRRTVK